MPTERLLALVPLAPDCLPTLIKSVLCSAAAPKAPPAASSASRFSYGLYSRKPAASAAKGTSQGLGQWGPQLVRVCVSCGLGPSTLQALQELLRWVLRAPAGAVGPRAAAAAAGGGGGTAGTSAAGAGTAGGGGAPSGGTTTSPASPIQGLTDALSLLGCLQTELAKLPGAGNGGGAAAAAGGGTLQGPQAQLCGQLCTTVADAVLAWRDVEVHASAVAAERARIPTAEAPGYVRQKELAEVAQAQRRQEEEAQKEAQKAVDKALNALVAQLFSVLLGLGQEGEVQLGRIMAHLCASMRVHCFDVVRVLGPAAGKLSNQLSAKERSTAAFGTLVSTCLQVWW